jgi:hypothetical protein
LKYRRSKGKEVITSKITEQLSITVDRHKVNNVTPLLWENELTEQIPHLELINTSQLNVTEAILSNNDVVTKEELSSDTHLEGNRKKSRISTRQRN